MPQIKFKNVNAKEAVDNVGGEGFYNGPVPTEKGTYPCFLKIFELVTNKHSDPMIRGLAVIDAPKGHKYAKFNGYGIWFQQNVTDQGTPFVNQLLNSLSDGTDEQARAIRVAFWGKGPVTEKPLPEGPKKSAGAILRIGPLKLGNLDDKKIRMLILGKRGSDQDGEDRLEAARYLMKKVEEEDEYEEDSDGLEEFSNGERDASVEDTDDGSDDDYEDDDEEDDEEDGLEIDEDEEDEDEDDDPSEEDDEADTDEDDPEEDDSDGEYDDEDEDEEPEPAAPVTPIKKAAKKSAKARKEPAF